MDSERNDPIPLINAPRAVLTGECAGLPDTLRIQGSACVKQGRDLQEITRLLEESRQRYAEREETLGDYLRTISHNLRQPLSVILTYAQLAANLADQPKRVRKSALAIVSAVKKTDSLIQDLMDSTRLDASRLILKKRPLDLAAVIRDLLARNGEVMPIDRIRITSPQDLPPIPADPDRLERIVVHLLNNALRYSPAKSEVSVVLARQGDMAVTSVADHGSGIDPADLPHLFARFYRTSSARAMGDGLGLGLYIAKGLVEAHAGRIWVESTPGRGSIFSFSLPICVCQKSSG